MILAACAAEAAHQRLPIQLVCVHGAAMQLCGVTCLIPPGAPAICPTSVSPPQALYNAGQYYNATARACAPRTVQVCTWMAGVRGEAVSRSAVADCGERDVDVQYDAEWVARGPRFNSGGSVQLVGSVDICRGGVVGCMCAPCVCPVCNF